MDIVAAVVATLMWLVALGSIAAVSEVYKRLQP